jgi:formylglycine-generating enzyme required for sulfatase activity
LFLFGCSKEERPTGETFTNIIGMEFILIPAVSFIIGTDDSFKNLDDRNYESPRHEVTITKPFYIGKYEVTQAEWIEIMGTNPSKFIGPNNPVEMVTYEDTKEFIRRLNAKDGHLQYRLPTKAEWEYTARAGTDNSLYWFGDDEKALDQYAWYENNSDKRIHPVGEKSPNPWGLYDIYGNVWEWVEDWFGSYPSEHVTDPKGVPEGFQKVHRGGSWYNSAEYTRSAIRFCLTPHDTVSFYLGFRLAISTE